MAGFSGKQIGISSQFKRLYKIKKYLIIFILINFISLKAQTKYFDPDGYYFPVSKLVLGGINIEWLEINTLDINKNSNGEYPKLLKPEINIRPVGTRKWLKTIDIIIDKDTLFFRYVISKNKLIEFSGTFIDKRGQYWNQNDIKQNTVIMHGIFKLIENGNIQDTKDCKFTYDEGD
jgi:hypothetical protein